MNKNDFGMEIKKALRRQRHQMGDFRSDEEVHQEAEQRLYYMEEQAMNRIRQLENGPEMYTIEDETSVSCVTREELIATVKERIRK